MSKKVLFLAPYPHGQAPSQRFRFEQYFDLLKNNNFDIEFRSFLNAKTWNVLYTESSFFAKTIGILGSLWRRLVLLFSMRKYDYVFIHREAAMIGPPIFEWIIAKVLRKKYIYDFDDAIWLPNYSDTNARFHRLKAYWKVKKIIKWADKVTVGNNYLKEFALKFNQNIKVIPTTIDLENSHSIETIQSEQKVNIGWTGTHTTMAYLDDLIHVIQKLENLYNFNFIVISNEAPKFKLKSLQFIKWNKSSEIEDLASIHIGLMPLPDETWAKGKCGFKALQYMALNIPTIASPVGVNSSIIKDGENGFLCDSHEEWFAKISLLLSNIKIREEIGKKGKETIINNYAVAAIGTDYINLFS